MKQLAERQNEGSKQLSLDRKLIVLPVERCRTLRNFKLQIEKKHGILIKEDKYFSFHISVSTETLRTSLISARRIDLQVIGLLSLYVITFLMILNTC